MYLEHYGLQRYPFRTNPDPRFLWFSEKHKEALAALKYGLLHRDGFLLLTGDVGTGKTSLIRYLLNSIDTSAIVAAIHDPDMPAMDFFNYLSAEFRLNKMFASKSDFLIDLREFLLRAYAERRYVFIIIDEAQRLTPERLEEVRLLSNIELDYQKLLNMFFVGQCELEEMLMHPRNRAVRQRISTSYRIEPLNQSETIHYIAHRLIIAGAKRGIFSVDACKEIFTISGGIPRLINSICDCALLSGYVKDRRTVDSKLIGECQIELRIPIGPSDRQADTVPEGA